MIGFPCKNPSCKSYGKPHPNCKCYMEMAEEHNVPPFEGMDCGDSSGDR